jgi:hypothetical protein
MSVRRNNRRQSGGEKGLAERGNSLLKHQKPADKEVTAGEKCASAQEK